MRRYRRYRPAKGRYRGEGIRFGVGKILVVLLLLGAALWAMESHLEPIFVSLTEHEAKQAAVASINQTVEEELSREGVSYDNLVTVERSTSGQVLSITTDVAQVNRLKAELSAAIQEKLSGQHVTVGVPIGTLLGSEWLHGRGPEIPLVVTLAGNVQADLKSSFTSAGINQTRHQIYLEVQTGIYSFLPGMNSTTDLTTSIAVAETVIVGEVPQFVTGIPGTTGSLSQEGIS